MVIETVGKQKKMHIALAFCLILKMQFLCFFRFLQNKRCMMNLKKVCICDHFGFGKDLLNGQTVKTKIVTDVIRRSVFLVREKALAGSYGFPKHGGLNV